MSELAISAARKPRAYMYQEGDIMLLVKPEDIGKLRSEPWVKEWNIVPLYTEADVIGDFVDALGRKL